MHNVKFLMIAGSGVVLALTACSAAPAESSGTLTSRLQTGASVDGEIYVESWDNEDVARDRANDMRLMGLWVDQEGATLRVHPAEGDLDQMMADASSDMMMGKWGGGGESGVEYASKKSLQVTSTLKPMGLTVQPLNSQIDGWLAGMLKVDGHLTATPDISIRPSTCGRGCLRLDGHASLNLEGHLEVAGGGSLKLGREVYPVLPNLTIGSTMIVIPTIIPIPVMVVFWVSADIACEGEVSGSFRTRADVTAGGEVSFWASMGKNQGPRAGASSNYWANGDFHREGAITGVSIGCSVPEIKLGARLYNTAGPFIAFGPKLTLSSGEDGGLSGRYSFDVGIGVEAQNVGWGAMKADVASWNLTDERKFF